MTKNYQDYQKDYTKPKLREQLKDKIKNGGKGGKKGQWSARKSQILVREYEKHGGGYKHSGKKSHTQNYTPPKPIAENAAKGLTLRKTFKRGGTDIGYQRACQLKKQKKLTIKTIKRMFSYFRRHEVDKKAKKFGNEKDPSKGYIAWLLWGGDEAYDWVKEILHK